MTGPGTAGRAAEVRAIRALRQELEALGVPVPLVAARADLAVAVVWADLIVWCDGAAFSWSSGQTIGPTRLHRYAFHPVNDPIIAARRITRRYAELRHGDLHAQQVTAALAATAENLLSIGPGRGGAR